VLILRRAGPQDCLRLLVWEAPQPIALNIAPGVLGGSGMTQFGRVVTPALRNSMAACGRGGSLMNLIRNLALAQFGLLGCVSAPAQAARVEPPVYIAVLEDTQTEEDSSISSQRHVRIAFRKEGPTWLPMDTEFNTLAALAEAAGHYPAAVTWTVVFDGKSLGTIASKNPGTLHWYADIGAQIITTNAADVPRVATGASDFVYSLRKARTRPLLLISAGSFRDPDVWKPTMLTLSERQLAVGAFRRKIPTLERCDKPEEQPVHMIPYADEEVLLLKAYRDKNGRLLLGERLDDSRSNCGFFDDAHFFDYWFLIDHQSVRYLDSQMTPLEAADIDGVGRSMWVFFTSRGEDEEGYELFYNDFTEQVRFHWTYH